MALPTMKKTFMHDVNAYLTDRINTVSNEIETASVSQLPVKHALRIGQAMELEAIKKSIDNLYYSSYSVMKTTEVNFETLVSTLKELPNDAPIKLAVIAGLGTKAPATTIQLIMGDIRRFAAIQKLYHEDNPQ